MVSRAESLRAHRFARRRIVNAISSGRADGRDPTRRAPAVLASLLLSLFAFGAVNVSHRLHQPPEWRRSGTVIAERETGAEFVYVSGTLHPVTNYTSARLIVGRSSARLVSVSRSDLRGVASGPAWGIASAPTWLPAAVDLVNSWAVCSDRAGHGSALFGEPVSGHPAEGVVVTSRGNSYVISGGHRAPYRDGGGGDPMHVSSALLSSIPASPRSSHPVSAASPDALCAFHDRGAVAVVVQRAAPVMPATIQPGRGALVQSDAGSSSDVELIVGGLRYPIKGADALASLGYDSVSPMTLPADVLHLVPYGVELSRPAALSTVIG